MSNQRVVLITGASSGVGQATARLLAQQGYTVFGTSRTPTGAEPLAAFVRRKGGINKCAERFTRCLGRHSVMDQER